MNQHRQGILQEVRLNTSVLTQELVDDSVVVQTTLNLVLDVGVLHFFVLLNDCLNFVNHALKRPISQVGCHLHVLALNV